MGTRQLTAPFLMLLLAAACTGSDTSAPKGPSEAIVETTPVSVAPATEAPSTTAQPPTTPTTAASTTEAESASDSDINAGPALDSVDSFVASWAAVASIFPDLPDLVPTITSADVAEDPTVGLDVFVEQATPSTVIGGLVDPETGAVTAVMGLSDPDSDDTIVMIQIVWVGAFGFNEIDAFTELFPLEELGALEVGEQITRVHNGKSVVMNYVEGATPDDGLFVFTVGAEDLLEVDPAHDTIANVVIGLLVRTS